MTPKQKKRTMIIVAAAVITVAAAVVISCLMLRADRTSLPENITDNRHITNGSIVYHDDTPPADARLVGEWTNDDNPQWHKVYYDDYDDESGYYWGKEWNEAEDVFEEDLVYHGNGWFRWKIEGKRMVHELHCMDSYNIPVAKNYRIRRNNNSLQLTDDDFKDVSFYFSLADE